MNDQGTTSVNISTSSFASPFWGTPTLTEMSLSANQPMAQMILNKYNWVTYQPFTMADVPQDYIDDETITLLPLQIRTFMVTFSGATSESEVTIQPNVVYEEADGFLIVDE